MVNRHSFLAIVCAVLALVITIPAAAQNKAVEAQARGLDKKAMEEDYLATEFDKAADKLGQAVSKCGTDKCSAQLRAQLKRDLGVVQAAGQGKKDQAIASFVDAIKTDPTVQLDPDLKTKEIELAWEEAKRQAGGGGTPKPATPVASSGPPTGDFTHTPATEQLVRTPVPIYAEYTGSEQLAKVIAKYKGFGMTEWKQIELKPLDKGYGGEIPCLDVQQGDLQYYLQGFNAQNDPVATAGDRNKAYRVPVKREAIASDPPHLPGREPPKQCQDAGDCPPGFPGCKAGGGESAESTLKSEGAECEEDTECKSSSCKEKVCAPGGEEGQDKPQKLRRFWIGISGQIDFIFLPSENDVCLLHGPGEPNEAQPVNSSGYYCTDGGADFPGRSSQANPSVGVSDKVSGGAAAANVRVLLNVDYAINANFMAGIRLGYVANTYPGAVASTFGPIHAEARLTYVIGKDALAKVGLSPYVFLAGGVGEFDAHVSVTVKDRPTDQGGPANPTSHSVDAWNVGGPGFVSLGGGLRYAFSPRFAGFVGPRVNVAFGGASTLLSISPEVGVAVGF